MGEIVEAKEAANLEYHRQRAVALQTESISEVIAGFPNPEIAERAYVEGKISETDLRRALAYYNFIDLEGKKGPLSILLAGSASFLSVPSQLVHIYAFSRARNLKDQGYDLFTPPQTDQLQAESPRPVIRQQYGPVAPTPAGTATRVVGTPVHESSSPANTRVRVIENEVTEPITQKLGGGPGIGAASAVQEKIIETGLDLPTGKTNPSQYQRFKNYSSGQSTATNSVGGQGYTRLGYTPGADVAQQQNPYRGAQGRNQQLISYFRRSGGGGNVPNWILQGAGFAGQAILGGGVNVGQLALSYGLSALGAYLTPSASEWRQDPNFSRFLDRDILGRYVFGFTTAEATMTWYNTRVLNRPDTGGNAIARTEIWNRYGLESLYDTNEDEEDRTISASILDTTMYLSDGGLSAIEGVLLDGNYIALEKSQRDATPDNAYYVAHVNSEWRGRFFVKPFFAKAQGPVELTDLYSTSTPGWQESYHTPDDSYVWFAFMETKDDFWRKNGIPNTVEFVVKGVRVPDLSRYPNHLDHEVWTDNAMSIAYAVERWILRTADNDINFRSLLDAYAYADRLIENPFPRYGDASGEALKAGQILDNDFGQQPDKSRQYSVSGTFFRRPDQAHRSRIQVSTNGGITTLGGKISYTVGRYEQATKTIGNDDWSQQPTRIHQPDVQSHFNTVRYRHLSQAKNFRPYEGEVIDLEALKRDGRTIALDGIFDLPDTHDEVEAYRKVNNILRENRQYELLLGEIAGDLDVEIHESVRVTNNHLGIVDEHYVLVEKSYDPLAHATAIGLKRTRYDDFSNSFIIRGFVERELAVPRVELTGRPPSVLGFNLTPEIGGFSFVRGAYPPIYLESRITIALADATNDTFRDGTKEAKTFTTKEQAVTYPNIVNRNEAVELIVTLVDIDANNTPSTPVSANVISIDERTVAPSGPAGISTWNERFYLKGNYFAHGRGRDGGFRRTVERTTEGRWSLRVPSEDYRALAGELTIPDTPAPTALYVTSVFVANTSRIYKSNQTITIPTTGEWELFWGNNWVGTIDLAELNRKNRWVGGSQIVHDSTAVTVRQNNINYYVGKPTANQLAFGRSDSTGTTEFALYAANIRTRVGGKWFYKFSVNKPTRLTAAVAADVNPVGVNAGFIPDNANDFPSNYGSGTADQKLWVCLGYTQPDGSIQANAYSDWLMYASQFNVRPTIGIMTRLQGSDFQTWFKDVNGTDVRDAFLALNQGELLTLYFNSTGYLVYEALRDPQSFRISGQIAETRVKFVPSLSTWLGETDASGNRVPGTGITDADLRDGAFELRMVTEALQAPTAWPARLGYSDWYQAGESPPDSQTDSKSYTMQVDGADALASWENAEDASGVKWAFEAKDVNDGDKIKNFKHFFSTLTPGTWCRLNVSRDNTRDVQRISYQIASISVTSTLAEATFTDVPVVQESRPPVLTAASGTEVWWEFNVPYVPPPAEKFPIYKLQADDTKPADITRPIAQKGNRSYLPSGWSLAYPTVTTTLRYVVALYTESDDGGNTFGNFTDGAVINSPGFDPETTEIVTVLLDQKASVEANATLLPGYSDSTSDNYQAKRRGASVVPSNSWTYDRGGAVSWDGTTYHFTDGDRDYTDEFNYKCVYYRDHAPGIVAGATVYDPTQADSTEYNPTAWRGPYLFQSNLNLTNIRSHKQFRYWGTEEGAGPPRHLNLESTDTIRYIFAILIPRTDASGDDIHPTPPTGNLPVGTAGLGITNYSGEKWETLDHEELVKEAFDRSDNKKVFITYATWDSSADQWGNWEDTTVEISHSIDEGFLGFLTFVQFLGEEYIRPAEFNEILEIEPPQPLTTPRNEFDENRPGETNFSKGLVAWEQESKLPDLVSNRDIRNNAIWEVTVELVSDPNNEINEIGIHSDTGLYWVYSKPIPHAVPWTFSELISKLGDRLIPAATASQHGDVLVSDYETGRPSKSRWADQSTLSRSPTLQSGAATTTSIALSWTAISGTGNYTVRYRRDGSTASYSTKSVNGLLTTVTGLSSNTRYVFQVSRDGTNWSNEVLKRTAAPATPALSSPLSVTATRSHNDVTITWVRPTTGTPTRYEWKLTRGASSDSTTVGAYSGSVTSGTTRAVVNDITPGTYKTFVRARDALGNISAWAEGTQFTYTASLSDVGGLRASYTHTAGTTNKHTVTLNWSAVSGATGYEATLALLATPERSNADGPPGVLQVTNLVSGGSTTTTTWTNINGGVHYKLWIRAHDANNFSGYTNVKLNIPLPDTS